MDLTKCQSSTLVNLKQNYEVYLTPVCLNISSKSVKRFPDVFISLLEGGMADSETDQYLRQL